MGYFRRRFLLLLVGISTMIAVGAEAQVVAGDTVSKTADTTRADTTRADTTRADTTRADTTRISRPPRSPATLTTVIVGASRIERRVQDEPERVEVLSGEDVGEKTVMHPANPATLLSEMPGVHIQTTSPALGGAGVSLQGLRGRYTLLLSDGLPIYGSSSEGLGFLQIPPLDLAQAEVVKGAATALYGPAAAGGVVNLISRRPPRSGRAESEILLNGTSRKGADGLLWLADSISSKSGYTLIAGAHDQSAVDVNGDGWADIPRFRRVEIRPRLFLRSDNGSSAMFTGGFSDERRSSGFIAGGESGRIYRAAASTQRGDLGAILHAVSHRGNVLTFRSSANQQWQDRQFGDSSESDSRGTEFAELSESIASSHSQALIGAGIQHDALRGERLRNARYNFLNESLFAQETVTPNERTAATATVRFDHHNRYGSFVSPRVSTLIRVGSGWDARASVGRGFFAPTPLVEETDAVGLSRVRNFNDLSAETVTQGSVDITRTMGPLEITGTVFRSQLASAVVTRDDSSSGTIALINAPRPTLTSGASFYALYNVDPISVTALYAYTRATEWSGDAATTLDAPLIPRHSGGLDFAYDEDESGTRVGVEIFYTGRQALADDPYRKVSLPYTTIGLLLEQRISRASLFLNGENLTGVRQTRFDPLLLSRISPTGRVVTPQWAPLEGRMINAGVRVSL